MNMGLKPVIVGPIALPFLRFRLYHTGVRSASVCVIEALWKVGGSDSMLLQNSVSPTRTTLNTWSNTTISGKEL